MISYTALIVVIVGWVMQLLEKPGHISKAFLGLYIVGIALLSYDGVTSLEGGRLYLLSALNLVTLLLATLVLNKMSKAEPKHAKKKRK